MAVKWGDESGIVSVSLRNILDSTKTRSGFSQSLQGNFFSNFPLIRLLDAISLHAGHFTKLTASLSNP